VQGFKEGEFYIEDQASVDCGIEFVEKLEKFWQWYYGLEEITQTNNFKYSKSEDAGRLAGNLPNSGFKTGEAGRSGVRSQLEKGIHISQTGKSAFHTGAAGKIGGRISASGPNHVSKTGVLQRASAASPNHTSKQVRTCPRCGLTKRGPAWLAHIKNGTSNCPLEGTA
jgi:hypothetical protein